MPTKLWSIRGRLAESEVLTKQANAFLDELVAQGGWYRESHITTAGKRRRPTLLITIVYEDMSGEDDATISRTGE